MFCVLSCPFQSIPPSHVTAKVTCVTHPFRKRSPHRACAVWREHTPTTTERPFCCQNVPPSARPATNIPAGTGKRHKSPRKRIQALAALSRFLKFLHPPAGTLRASTIVVHALLLRGRSSPPRPLSLAELQPSSSPMVHAGLQVPFQSACSVCDELSMQFTSAARILVDQQRVCRMFVYSSTMM